MRWTVGTSLTFRYLVVDDAIIDVENSVRRLRQNRAEVTPRPPRRVVLEASLEVRTLSEPRVHLPLISPVEDPPAALEGGAR